MNGRYGRPWYVQAADVVHRLSVLAIVGGSLWLAGGLGMTMWANRNNTPRKLLQQQRREQQMAEHSGANAESSQTAEN